MRPHRMHQRSTQTHNNNHIACVHTACIHAARNTKPRSIPPYSMRMHPCNTKQRSTQLYSIRHHSIQPRKHASTQQASTHASTQYAAKTTTQACINTARIHVAHNHAVHNHGVHKHATHNNATMQQRKHATTQHASTYHGAHNHATHNNASIQQHSMHPHVRTCRCFVGRRWWVEAELRLHDHSALGIGGALGVGVVRDNLVTDLLQIAVAPRKTCVDGWASRERIKRIIVQLPGGFVFVWAHNANSTRVSTVLDAPASIKHVVIEADVVGSGFVPENHQTRAPRLAKGVAFNLET